jgi:hypothetical protein
VASDGLVNPGPAAPGEALLEAESAGAAESSRNARAKPGAPSIPAAEPSRATATDPTAPSTLPASGAETLASDPAAGSSAVCWQMPIVDRARLHPAAGQAAALAGGKIAGSNTSAMNGFVDLALITAATDDWIDLPFSNSTAYRYVKYYGPAGSHGTIAEVEFYSGDVRLTGGGFGTAGSRAGTTGTFALALDGDVATAFEGPLPNDNYVGLDLAAEHVPAAPTFTPAPGTFATPPLVSLSAAPGAQLFYTLDGSDPQLNGIPYSGPITVASTSLLRAAATLECSAWSEPSQALYDVGAPDPSIERVGTAQSSLHIGNSLTDTIVDYLPEVAQAGGFTLDFNRYTIPGAGTWLYEQNPSGGFGVPNVQEALRTRSFDHVSMQPFPNNPCQITASADGSDSDSGYLNMAFSDALGQNPNVQFWVYQQWPSPIDINNCITGGTWTRGDWAPEAPADWEAAIQNELSYDEAVLAELVRLNPDAPPPFIVPGGLALVNLKHAVEAGSVPGISDFFGQLFQQGGTDIHLTPMGAYYVTLVFYACMFQDDPEGLAPAPAAGVSAEQALVLQQLAWETASSYASSGVSR